MLVLLIIVVSFVLRLININQSLWLDEAVQAITAKGSFSYIFQEIIGDFHPPLYYFLMHFWVRIFGDSEIALRMPSMLFGVGTVYLVYKLSRLSGLSNLRYLSAIFLAAAPFHIYYSQEARMYSMATFLSTLSMYFFIKINGPLIKCINHRHPDLDGGIPFLDRKRKGFLDFAKYQRVLSFARNDNILYFISTFCLIYTDYYGFLILLAQAIYLLIKKKYKFLLICLFVYLLIYVPWFPMFIKQIKTGMLATQTLPQWGKLVNLSFFKAIPLTFIKFTIGRITVFDKKIYGLISLGILGMLGFLGILGIKRKIRSDFGKIVILWLFVPLIIAWLASLFVPNFQPFRLLLILPAFYLILTEGIVGIGGERWARRVIITIFLAINLISLSVYYFNPYFHRENWRGLTKYLIEQPGTVILPSETSSWPIKYYDKNNKIRLIGIGKNVGEIGEIGEIGNNNQIFYIRYLSSVFDPRDKILLELDKEGYNKEEEISFNQIPVWRFEKK